MLDSAVLDAALGKYQQVIALNCAEIAKQVEDGKEPEIAQYCIDHSILVLLDAAQRRFMEVLDVALQQSGKVFFYQNDRQHCIHGTASVCLRDGEDWLYYSNSEGGPLESCVKVSSIRRIWVVENNPEIKFNLKDLSLEEWILLAKLLREYKKHRLVALIQDLLVLNGLISDADFVDVIQGNAIASPVSDV